MSRFGTLELNTIAILNMSNEVRCHCRVRVKLWKVAPAPVAKPALLDGWRYTLPSGDVFVWNPYQSVCA